MIPDDVKEKISSAAEELARLEAEGSRIALGLMALVAAHMATKEGCKELVGLLPVGYCTFKARQALDALERKEREEKAKTEPVNVARCGGCGKYAIYDPRNFHPYCGCGYDRFDWNDGLTGVTREEAERFRKANQ